MRIYELTIILEPNLDKEAVNSEIDKLTDMVTKANGTVVEIQHLGMRRLTFEIAGCTQGNYYTIYFKAPASVLTQMDKSMKLNEAVLRSMTIVLKESIYEASKKKKSEDRKPSAMDDDADEDNHRRRRPSKPRDEDFGDEEDTGDYSDEEIESER